LTRHKIKSGTALQRLFSTFANGWPGAGLLLLRMAVCAYLIYDARNVPAGLRLEQDVPRFLAAAAGLLLLLGLWTPLAGVVSAIAELWLAPAETGDLWLHVMVTTIATCLTMLGPGAWSLDARLFGRKRISVGRR
jgi:putative oxidoreductase